MEEEKRQVAEMSEAARRAGAWFNDHVESIVQTAERQAEELRRDAEYEAEATRREAVDSANRVFDRIRALERPLAELVEAMRDETLRVERQLQGVVDATPAIDAPRADVDGEPKAKEPPSERAEGGVQAPPEPGRREAPPAPEDWAPDPEPPARQRASEPPPKPESPLRQRAPEPQATPEPPPMPEPQREQATPEPPPMPEPQREQPTPEPPPMPEPQREQSAPEPPPPPPWHTPEPAAPQPAAAWQSQQPGEQQAQAAQPAQPAEASAPQAPPQPIWHEPPAAAQGPPADEPPETDDQPAAPGQFTAPFKGPTGEPEKRGGFLSRFKGGLKKEQVFITTEGYCAICQKGLTAGSEENLRTSGWLVSGDVGVCPDCQRDGWKLTEGAKLPFRRGGG